VDIKRVRQLLSDHSIDIEFSLPHALVEAKKDGLTVADLERAVMAGELVEDYGERALLLDFASEYEIPFHIVVEYATGDPILTVVTAYVPSREGWQSDWKTRKKTPRVKKKPKKRR
jgi:hypothetical protein